MTTYGAVQAADTISQIKPNRIAMTALHESIQDFCFIKNFGFKDSSAAGNLKKTKNVSDGGIILYSDEFKPSSYLKGRGDTVTLKYLPTQEEEPVEGDNIDTEANAYQWTYDYFQFSINLGTLSQLSPGQMEIQRTAANVDEDMTMLLKQNFQIWLAKEFCRKVSGQTANDFANTPTTPSSNRIFYSGSATSSSDMTSTDYLTLNDLNNLKAIAYYRTSSLPPVERLRRSDGIDYVFLCHPWMTNSLANNSDYNAIMQRADVRGSDNQLFNGDFQVFMRWHNILIVTSNYMPTFTNYGAGSDVNAARGVLLGRNALAFGAAMDAELVTEEKNAKTRVIKTVKFIMGMQKIKPTTVAQDLGVIAIDSAVNALIS